MRMAVLSAYDKVLTFIDNDAPDALHFYDDLLTTYLQGNAATLNFSTPADHSDTQYLQAGNKISFQYGRDDYYFNIINVENDGETVTIECESLTFELLNETAQAVNAKGQTFVQLYKDLGFEDLEIRININEVSDIKKDAKFDADDTLLQRLFSMADLFGAELEFKARLNRDYSLSRFDLNIYKSPQHGGKGMGSDHRNRTLRFGKDYTALSRRVDISELYTAIRPKGATRTLNTTTTVTETTKDATGAVIRTVQTTTFDSDDATEIRKVTTVGAEVTTTTTKQTKQDGKVVSSVTTTTTNGVKNKKTRQPSGATTTTRSTSTNRNTQKTESTVTLSGYTAGETSNGMRFLTQADGILCPTARDRFPSTLTGWSGDRYIYEIKEYPDCDDQASLYEQALKDLKDHCQPKVTYEFGGYIEGARTGDTFTVEDNELVPTLYAVARVIKQEICFTDKAQCSTTLDNFTVVKPQLTRNLLAEVHAMFEAHRMFKGEIVSDHGTLFKTNADETTLTALVYDGENNVTGQFAVSWFQDGKKVTDGYSYQVLAKNLTGPSLFRFEASKAGKVKAFAEVTIAPVKDGASSYFHVKYAPVASPTAAQLEDWPDKYIGTYTDFTKEDSKDPARYKWAKLQGDAGKPSYIHVAYANSLDGTLDFSLTDSDNHFYLGVYCSLDATASTSPKDYKWSKIRGQDGKDGRIIYKTQKQFCLSDSDKQPGAGSWTYTMPAFDSSKFLWTRWEIDYRNPTGVDYSVAVLDPVWVKASEAIETADKAADTAQQTENALKSIQDSVSALDAKTDKEISDLPQKVLEQASKQFEAAGTADSLIKDLRSQVETNAADIQTKVDSTAYQADTKTTNDRLDSLSKTLSDSQTTLTQTRKTLDDLSKSSDATRSELDAAKKAVDDAQDRLNKAQDAINALQTRVSANESNITETSKSIAATVTTEIGKLKAGERNLIFNSNFAVNKYWQSAGNPVFAGDFASRETTWYKIVSSAEAGDYISQSTSDRYGSWEVQEIYPGQPFSFSVLAWSETAPATLETEIDFNDAAGTVLSSVSFSFTLGADPQRFKYGPVNVPDKATGFSVRIGQIKGIAASDYVFTQLKAEIGNIPTDWSPAPEDLSGSVDDLSNWVNGSINSLSTQIQATSTDLSAQVSSLSGSVDSLSGNVTNLKQTADAITESISAISDDQQLSQAKKLTEYITESQNGLTISSTADNSRYAVNLNQNELSFLDGGAQVAYMSNKSMHIDRASIDTLDLGNFEYRVESDGSLSFTRK